MNEKEKIEFLRKMGFSVSRLGSDDARKKEKKERPDTRIDKSDLLALARKFDVVPDQKKPQTLDAFLEQEDGD
jgi:hypothetical protein